MPARSIRSHVFSVFYRYARMISAGCWTMGFYLLWRIPRCSGKRERLQHDGCSVIIPARNEAANLPRLLSSLKPQLGPEDEIVVIDDHSTDRTSQVARTAGVSVHRSEAHPPGWTGKTWACHQGARLARNKILLFVDADTWFAPDGLNRIIATLQKKTGIVSVQPYHSMKLPYERLSAVFNLMQLIGVDAFALGRINKAPSGAFGPCIACYRSDYDQIGGHERVRDLVLENVALGALFRQSGKNLNCYGGKETLFFRMYPDGIVDLFQGWVKGIARGGAQTPLPVMLGTIAWISGAFLASIQLAAYLSHRKRTTTCTGVFLYVAYVAQIYWMIRRIGAFGVLTCLLFPVNLCFFTIVYMASVYANYFGGNVTWKGRSVKVRGQS